MAATVVQFLAVAAPVMLESKWQALFNINLQSRWIAEKVSFC